MVLYTLGQDVPLHHPYGGARGVLSITKGCKAPVEARRSVSKGLFTLSKQLQWIGPLLLVQTDKPSSCALISQQATEKSLTWQKSRSRFGARGDPLLRVTEPYNLVAPPPIGRTDDGTKVKVSCSDVNI